MKIDYTYTKIIKDIFKHGYNYEDPNRKNVYRKELEFAIIEHFRTDDYPIITARKIFFKGAVGELLLFLKGSTDIRDFWKYKIRFWDKDFARYQNYSENFVKEKLYPCWERNEKIFSEKEYDMGKIYSYQYEKQHSIFDKFKENPLRTDLIVNSWQLNDLKDMALIPCFLENSKINTISGEYKNIQDIKIGDKVLTKEGNYKLVYNVMENDYDDFVCDIRTHGSPYSIKATREHPFWVNDKGWVNAENLKEGDYLSIPINKENEIPTFEVNGKYGKKLSLQLKEKEQWFLMGYFLGDGWVSQNRIILAINDNQFESINNKIKSIFKIKKIETGKNCHKYVITNTEYFDIFKLFGSGAKNKLIPKFVHNAPNELVSEFLNGYFMADGCHVKYGKKATTISDNIAFGIQLLCAKLKKKLSLYYQNRSSTKRIGNREVNQQNTYSLDLKEIVKNETKNYFFDDDYMWVKINKISKEKQITKVYNLSVEDSNTYTVNNIVTHNCHYDFQIVGSNDGFIIVWNQRSTDILLGTPINVQFYYLMGLLLEKWSGHIFNGVVGILKKVHLYDNGFDLAERIVNIAEEKYCRDIVVDIEINNDDKNLSFGDFIKKIEPSNFKMMNYNYVIDDKVEMLTYKK